MDAAHIKAGRRLVEMEKSAGWAWLATQGARLLPWLGRTLPKLFGSRIGGALFRAAPSIGRGALSGARSGVMWGGGMGAAMGALGAQPGESRLQAALRGGTSGATSGFLLGGLGGGLAGGARYALAPRMYRGATVRTVGEGGKLEDYHMRPEDLGMNLTPRGARLIASGGIPGPGGIQLQPGQFVHQGQLMQLQPHGLGRALSWLPGAASMAAWSLPVGGGVAAGAETGPSMPAFGMGYPDGMQPMMFEPGMGYMPPQMHPADIYRMRVLSQLDPYMYRSAGYSLGMTKRAGSVSRLGLTNALPQYGVTPLSAKTAISDFIANRKYDEEPNEYTSDEQETIDRLLAGMSRSRARVVDAHRQGRKDVSQQLQQLFQAAGLWS